MKCIFSVNTSLQIKDFGILILYFILFFNIYCFNIAYDKIIKVFFSVASYQSLCCPFSLFSHFVYISLGLFIMYTSRSIIFDKYMATGNSKLVKSLSSVLLLCHFLRLQLLLNKLLYTKRHTNILYYMHKTLQFILRPKRTYKHPHPASAHTNFQNTV